MPPSIDERLQSVREDIFVAEVGAPKIPPCTEDALRSGRTLRRTSELASRTVDTPATVFAGFARAD